MTERCPDCGRQITRSPTDERLEYGHERSAGSTGTTERCPRRPAGVDPQSPRAKVQRGER